MKKSKRGTFVLRAVVETIIREAPLDDKFGDDVDAAFGDRVGDL